MRCLACLMICTFLSLLIPFTQSSGSRGNLKKLDLPTVNPSVGGLVPEPQVVKYGSDNLTLSSDSFKFSTGLNACDILTNAFTRYRQVIFGSSATSNLNKLYSLKAQHSLSHSNLELNPFTVLNVLVTSAACEKYPYFGMNENYTLSVWSNGTGLLNVSSVWGALRGLETFSQLVFSPDGTSLQIRTAQIQDYPRFAHRGLLLDTSRHFLNKATLLENIDLLAQNKYNVFHWHIVDDQSFPFVSKVFPALSAKGAYTPNHVYSPDDVAEIVEYARQRGIRVVSEFDNPGHTEAWGPGQPGLLAPCYTNGTPNGDFGPVDPTQPSNYDFMIALLLEVLSVFPDTFIHLGGDEVDFSCWQSNPQINSFMQSMGFPGDYKKLESYYIANMLSFLQRVSPNTSHMLWQEPFDNGVALRPDTIVHVWKDGWQNETAAVTSKGYRTVLSSCWYLNYINYGIDWHDFYTCDPHNFNGTDAQKALVMGGETCMWGEYVDATNVIARTWPRASVVAERLWSSKTLTSVNAFAPRLEEHRCRLMKRGFQVEPANGPGFCPWEWGFPK